MQLQHFIIFIFKKQKLIINIYKIKNEIKEDLLIFHAKSRNRQRIMLIVFQKESIYLLSNFQLPTKIKPIVSTSMNINENKKSKIVQTSIETDKGNQQHQFIYVNDNHN